MSTSTSMTVGHEKLRVIHKAIHSGKNMTVIGPHGIGKTQVIRSLASTIPNTIVRYLSLAQVQATDLLVPYMSERRGRRWVEYIPHSLFDNTDEYGNRHPLILILDEFNRVDAQQVHNALLEFMGSGTMAGVPLDIHCFVALMNPSTDSYFGTSAVEAPVMDRFHLYIPVDQYELGADVYLASTYPEAPAVIEWYLSLPDHLKSHVPPRRQEMIIQNWRDGIDPSYSLPPDTEIPVDFLRQLLEGNKMWTVKRIAENTGEAIQELNNNPRNLALFLALVKTIRSSDTAREVLPLVLEFPSFVVTGLAWHNPQLWGPVLLDHYRSRNDSSRLVREIEQLEKEAADVKGN